MTDAPRKPTLLLALVPVVFLIAALFFTIIVFEKSAHMPLVAP